jgi:hypothetical protein
MEKEDIVRKLLSRGVMVSPDILEKIKDGGVDAFLEKTDTGACAVVGAGAKEGERLSCTIGAPGERGEMTPEDAAGANAEKYERIRKMLLRKVDAVSINNLGRSSSKVCVIGMVKDKVNGGFVIEDGTGEIEVRNSESVDLDDVIGIRGWLRDRTFFAEEILLPDIPMSREPGSMDNTILLSCGAAVHPGKADVILTPCTIQENGKEKNLPNPAWIFLDKGKKKITVLVYKTDGKGRKEEALQWLKKRYVGKDSPPIAKKERVLEPIPDIFWIVSDNEPWTENYKGVSLVSFGEGHSARVDLKKRKIEVS